MNKQNLYGLVLCGGQSSRMREDKCFLEYHGKAQCYYVYEMLQQFCEETYISCNANQYPLMDKQYKTLADLDVYKGKGPATGVLTAFNTYPDNNFLVIGCDYPLLSETEIRNFLQNIPGESVAAAFYDDSEQRYQPVLAWYSSALGAALMKSSENEHFSLKYFLQSANAYKHKPIDISSLKSVDTREESEYIIRTINIETK